MDTVNATLRQLLVAVLLVVTSGSAAAAEIIAHRGASADAPENTLAAINLAWRQGADAVEIDIRQTRDGRAVVIHDETPAAPPASI
jgi:glycerophosphoryl diester phosphodiesterase